MQWIFDKRILFGEDTEHLSLVSSGADAIVQKTNDGLVALAQTELMEAMPHVRDAKLVRATVVREPRATFATAVGQQPRPKNETGVSQVLLTGDWTGNGLPATIESA